METKKKCFTRSAFIWSFAVVFILASCSGSGDDEKFSINKNKLTLHYEETEQLTASESAEWISENDFVAGVSSDGLVEGGHVGKTNIVATAAGGSAVCEVEITPVYSTYIEPFLGFGASKETVKSKETRDLKTEDSTYLVYKGENSLVNSVLYSFDDSGKLKFALVGVSMACASEAMKFLLERYLPIGEKDDTFYFINGNPDDCTIGVGLSLQQSYILIMYIPNPSTNTKSGSCDRLKEEMECLLNKAVGSETL